MNSFLQEQRVQMFFFGDFLTMCFSWILVHFHAIECILVCFDAI